MTPALRVSGVVRRFRDKVALDGVDLEVSPGAVHALIGPNGAGKTTLLRAATGLLDPDEGSITVMGVDTRSDPLEVRRRIGFVASGDRTFYLRVSGLENLSFFGRLYGLSRRESLLRGRAAMADVGLEAAARERVGSYSHGMQKRLGMARALMVDPPVLLVDEATHDLDPEAARTVRDLVVAAAGRGTAVLWTTQRLEELHGFADAVTVLSTGRVRFAGTVPELAARASVRSYLLRLPAATPADVRGWDAALGDAAALELAPELGVEHARLVLGPGSRLGSAVAQLERLGASVDGCAETRSTLEDAFLRLTARPAGDPDPMLAVP